MLLAYKFIAIDQHDNHVWIKKHPRKELLDYMGMRHADRMYMMYIDDKEGHSHHIGYVIGGRWFTVHAISDWDKS